MKKDVKPLITWLLKKVKSKPIFNANKLYASEILNILLQNSLENRSILASLNGIDLLLQVASVSTAHYRIFALFILNCLIFAVLQKA